MSLPFPDPLLREISEAAIFPTFTLRDYFAAQAMSAMLANPYTAENMHRTGISKLDQQSAICANAYQIADAMLAEGKKL